MVPVGEPPPSGNCTDAVFFTSTVHLPIINHLQRTCPVNRWGSEMSFVAKLYDDDRLAERYPVMLDGTLRNSEAEPHDVIIDDLSASGFRTGIPMGLVVGDVITLGIFGVGLRPARVLRDSDGYYGCQFFKPLSDEELAAALCGLTPPEPVLLHQRAAADRIVGPEGREAEWSLSPRLRILSIAMAGLAPWGAAGLLWHSL